MSAFCALGGKVIRKRKENVTAALKIGYVAFPLYLFVSVNPTKHHNIIVKVVRTCLMRVKIPHHRTNGVFVTQAEIMLSCHAHNVMRLSVDIVHLVVVNRIALFVKRHILVKQLKLLCYLSYSHGVYAG